MAINDRIIDVSKLLSILTNHEELIIKPFHSSLGDEIGVIECGKIVSRGNQTLFDYQIGEQGNSCIIGSIFYQKIILSNPETKEIIVELNHNRLPFLGRICKQGVRCLTTLSNDYQSIGSIQQRFAFIKIWYDVFNNKHEHVVSLMLRKRHLKSKIQHRILEFSVLDQDDITNIGGIYPYSTDLERSEYGHAVAMKIPQNMKVEIKATLLITALILKSQLD